MDPAVVMAGTAGLTIASGLLGLKFSGNGYRARIKIAKGSEIPRGLRTAALMIQRFYYDIGVKPVGGNVGYQTRTLFFLVPSRLKIEQIIRRKRDLEHYLLSHGITMLRNSLQIEIAGKMTISWAVSGGREVRLTHVYRQHYRTARMVGGVFPVGLDMNGNPFSVILNREESPHALIVGSSGSGKTMCSMCLVIGAIKCGWDVTILNPKRKPDPPRPGLWDFMDSGSVTYVNSYTDMIIAANSISSELGKHDRPMLIVADELADILSVTGRDVGDPLGAIAAKGREYNVHVVGVVPKTTKAVLLNDLLHANAGAVLIGMRANTKNLSQYGAGIGNMGLEKLAGNGHAKVRQGGEITEVQMALPDNIATVLGGNASMLTTQDGLLPITAMWIDSIPPGGSVSKDAFRRFASNRGMGQGYDVIRDQWELLVEKGRISEGARFQAGEKVA